MEKSETKKKISPWLTQEKTLSEVINEFKKQNPNVSIEGMNGLEMRHLLAGTKVMVRKSGTRKFEIWKTEDIESGKLAAKNRETRARNAAIRRRNREIERNMHDAVRGGDEAFENIAKMISEAFR